MTPVKSCEHLAPLERELSRIGVELGEAMQSPYGSEWGDWFPVNCTFDGEMLRARLELPEFINYEEYDGRVAGSDATFYCKTCNRAIMGLHRRYAPRGTAHLE